MVAAAPWLSPDELAISYVSLILVLMLGGVLLAAVVTGARYVRRQNRRPSSPSRMVHDAWYEKPLVDSESGPTGDESSENE